MQIPKYTMGLLLGFVAATCMADDAVGLRMSIPLEPGTSHENVMAEVKRALGLEAADFVNDSAKRNLEIRRPPNFEFDDRIHPATASEKLVAPRKSVLTYTRALGNAASTSDMGPPRGRVELISTTVEVDTTSAAAAIISISTRGGDESYNNYELKNVSNRLRPLMQQTLGAGKASGARD